MGSLVLEHPHWNALTPAMQDVFHLLERSAFMKRFYLAGGTGLALHFGHRFSVDLDLLQPTNLLWGLRSVPLSVSFWMIRRLK